MKSWPAPAAFGPALACALVAVVAALSSAARAQAPQYVVTDLGTLGGTFSSATAINDVGQITGGAYDAGQVEHAFLYSGGVMTNLDTLNSATSFGLAINSSGVVVGDATYSTQFTSFFGFTASGGGMSALGSTGEAHAINNNGQIVGTSGTQAFLYTGGTYQNLGTLTPLPFTLNAQSFGIGLNNAGQVVGFSTTTPGSSIMNAFLYSGGKMTDLNPLGETNMNTAALAINDSGQITGDIGNHAMLYSGNHMTDLGTLGGTISDGYDINNAGQIVGDSDVTGDAEQHAILYSNGTMYDLNNLVINLGSTDLSYLEIAGGINNSGTIVGLAETANGDEHAFEAQLVPEPEASALLLLAAAGLTMHWRRRATS